MGTRLTAVAGEVSTRVEVERIGSDDAVVEQAESGGLSVVARLLTGGEVLVGSCCLGFRTVGVHEHGDVHIQGPAVIDGIDGPALGVLCGHDRVDGCALLDILLVLGSEYLEILHAGKLNILSDSSGDGAGGGVDVSRDLKIVGSTSH